MENQTIIDRTGQCDHPNNKQFDQSTKVDSYSGRFYGKADSIPSTIQSPISNIWYTYDRGAISFNVASTRISNTNLKKLIYSLTNRNIENLICE